MAGTIIPATRITAMRITAMGTTMPPPISAAPS